jgi:asparagine synthase
MKRRMLSLQWTALRQTIRSLYVRPSQCRDRIPHFIWHMYEPVAEAPARAFYLIAKALCEHVTVVFSGKGADELFGRYTVYRWIDNYRKVPDSVRSRLEPILCGYLHAKHWGIFTACTSPSGRAAIAASRTMIRRIMVKVRCGAVNWILKRAMKDRFAEQVLGRKKARLPHSGRINVSARLVRAICGIFFYPRSPSTVSISRGSQSSD